MTAPHPSDSSPAWHPDSLDVPELEAHAQWLRRLARGLTGNEALAEEVAQESWRAWVKRGGGPIENLRAWLAVTAKRVALHNRRSQERRRWRERAAALPEASDDPRELEERLELQRGLADELTKLREPYRGLLVQRYFDDLSTAEIARRRGIPTGTVRSQLSRGLAELRERLERREGQSPNWAMLLLSVARDGKTSSSALPLLPMIAMPSASQSAIALAFAATIWIWLGNREETPVQSELQSQSPSMVAGVLPETPSPTRGEGTELTEEREEVSSSSVEVLAAEEAIEASPLLGRIVDSRTREALPNYAIKWIAAGKTNSLLTGPDGSFVSEEEHPHGAGKLVTLDHSEIPQNKPQEFELTHPFESEDIAVLTGPTVEFDLTLPQGVSLEQLGARFVSNRVLQLVEGGSMTPLRAGSLRDGQLPWVRFGPGVNKIAGSGPWTLVVEDRDGLWRGEGQVPGLVGIQPNPVRIELESFGALRVRVVNDDGPVYTPSYLFVTSIDPVEEGRRPLERRASLFFGGDPDLTPMAGTFVMRSLPTGRYRVSIDDDRHEAASVEVDVLRGVLSEHELHLEPRADLGTLSGTISTRNGIVDPSFCYVEAKGIAPTVGSFLVRPQLEEDGRFHFRFEEVPPGTYRVRAMDLQRHPFEPEEVEATMGTSNLHFECRDDLPAQRMAVLCFVDAETGESIPGVHAMIRWHDPATGKRDGFYTRTDLNGRLEVALREGSKLAWMARKDGYAAVIGDASDLDGGCEVPFQLSKSWAEEFMLHQGQERVPGVTVLVDGQVAGTTDEDGRLLLRADEAPATITIDSDRWQVIAGGPVQADGSWSPSMMGLSAQVRAKE